MLTRTAAEHGLILLYHFISAEEHDNLSGTVHTTSVATLERHLLAVASSFSLVSLEEFCAARNKSGLAAVTFDDGYRNVIENGLPLLESLGIPFTMFLNGVTLAGEWNWRDKVRYVIAHDLVDQFRNRFKLYSEDGRFYRDSKHSANNSARIDQYLDEFIGSKQIDIYADYPYAQLQELTMDMPLLGIGNHSFNHYVLSSLDDNMQHREIHSGAAALNEVPGFADTGVFSAPFGGDLDINSTTCQAVQSLGYHSILMSRQRLQPDRSDNNGLQVLERFMPRCEDIAAEIGRHLTT